MLTQSTPLRACIGPITDLTAPVSSCGNGVPPYSPPVLNAAFVILGIAALLGSALAVSHLRENATAPSWPFGALHGLIAIGGLVLLALALRGPPRGLDQGTASFGAIAAALIALAAAAGLALLGTRLRKRRPAGALIGLHATLAIGGFVVLIAYVLAG